MKRNRPKQKPPIASRMDFEGRILQLQKTLKKEKVSAFLINSHASLRYFSGFDNKDALILLTPQKLLYVTDDRYLEAAKTAVLVKNTELVNIKKGMKEILKETFPKRGVLRLFVEEETLTMGSFERLKKARPGIRLLGGGEHVAKIRMIKEPAEVALIKKATQVADRAMRALMKEKIIGVTEAEVERRLIRKMEDFGAEGESFRPIVAFGPGSSTPHYASGNRKIGKNSLLLLDWGAKYRGYCSDCTRTYVLGKGDPELVKAWEVTRRAQKAQLDALKPGVSLRKIDRIGRRIIDRSGFKDLFKHSTGHGVGLDVHEGPGVHKKSKLKAAPGMILTIEPGIYIEGKGGIRIEDLVLVTKKGIEILTRLPKRKEWGKP